MSNMIYDKFQRRDILSKIDSWNVGIGPNGKLASVSCFVHESVPDIKFVKSDFEAEDIIPIATKSQWTKNLVKAQVYYNSSNDNSTLNSLSLCKTIFNNEFAFQSNIDTIHYINNQPKLYIEAGKIARLTFEFEEELKIAQGHWPTHPQKSWDTLCQIWHKFGFLWAEYVYLDIDVQQQERGQQEYQSPEIANHSIIWRTHLRPIHDFFPESHNQYKEFIVNMIYRFSGCILNGKKFRLLNVKTGNYLSRQKNGDAKTVDIMMINQQHKDSVWTFQDRHESALKYQTPYLCAGGKKIICSTGTRDQSDLVELSILDKMAANDGQLRLINYYMPNNTPFNKIYTDVNWQWSIQSYETLINSKRISSMFNLDHIIDQHRCIKHGDILLLNQSSMFLCERILRQSSPMPSQYSSKINSPVQNQSANDSYLKPPSSISTNRDMFNFSSISESNSTQPTISSSRSKNMTTTSVAYLQSMEILNPKKLTEEFQWRIELAESNTIVPSSDLARTKVTSTNDHISTDMMISSFLQLKVDPLENIVDVPLKSQWLDGNDKLYNLNMGNNFKSPLNISQDNTPSQYDKSNGSIRSIPSKTSIPLVSEKKMGKQPLRKDVENHFSSESSTSSDSDWTVSPSSSLSSTPKRSSGLTEAQKFKLQIQQEFSQQEKALESIYKNVMLNTTPLTNNTSQIQYYDDYYPTNESSHLQDYNMVNGDRFSPQYTPTSTANMSPEELSLRRQNRENSFMLLLKEESKHDIFFRAMEKSSLNAWIRTKVSPSSKKADQQLHVYPILSQYESAQPVHNDPQDIGNSLQTQENNDINNTNLNRQNSNII